MQQILCYIHFHQISRYILAYYKYVYVYEQESITHNPTILITGQIASHLIYL